jgi:hypothetical protein
MSNRTYSTTTDIPIPMHKYNKNLLSCPMPKMYDDSETLYQMYQYIKLKLQKKCNYGNRQDKFLKLEKEFLDIYEQIKKKEKNIETETGQSVGKPFYYIRVTDKRIEKIFSGIRIRQMLAYFKSKCRKDAAISQV